MDTIGVFNQTLHTLQHAHHVLLVPHRLPDADSLGGALTTREILKKLGVPSTIFCKTHIPSTVSFMLENETVAASLPHDIDVLCVFDSGDADYAHLPEIIAELPNKPTTINIDHHTSNTHFADINLVMPYMPSTTAVLYLFMDHHGMHITPRMARHMMTGLINDTGIFSNPAANQHAMAIGAALIEAGARVPEIINALHRVKPIGTLKLWGRALERIKQHPRLPIAYTCLTHNDHIECGVSFEESAGLANFFNLVADCPISLILKDTGDGYVKGSLRTTHDAYDVSKLALALGGGGHKKAAGFTIPGTLEQTHGKWRIVQHPT